MDRDAVSMSRRILLVENDLAVREVVTAALTDSGYEVTASSALDDAVARLSAAPFDLVLTSDFTTGAAEVLTASAPVRAAAGRTPVILLTSYDVTPDEVRAAGFRDVVTKPFDLAALDAVVARAIGS